MTRTRDFGKQLKGKLDSFFGVPSADAGSVSDDREPSDEDLMGEAMAASMPIRSIVSFGLMEKEELLKKLAEFNG